jgi:hypothetical protein
MWIFRHVRHWALRSVVLLTLQSLSSESDTQAVSIGDGIAKSGRLPTVSGAVVAREVFDFLATMVANYPAYDVD